MISVQQAKQLTEKADIISFDVFDTLITRKVLHPTDVFCLVELLAKKEHLINFDFKKARIESEYSLLNSKKRFIYNIYDIYNLISEKYALSEELTSKLLEIEIEAEKMVVIPREDVKELFFELYNHGKKIILISDMYLLSDQIRALLEKCGYPKDVELIVSNEHAKVKADGSLWNEIFDSYNEKSFIHFGDNVRSDYNAVKKMGYDAIITPNPFDRFSETEMYSILQEYDNGDLSNSLLLGYFCNGIVFNNAFSDAFDKNAILGLWNGSVLSCFVRWLIKNKDDSLLLFVTREGYILQPLYLEYCRVAGIEPQKSCLFFASRQATSTACILNDEDFVDITEQPYNGSLKRFLSSRCGLMTDDDKLEEIKIKLPDEQRRVLKLLEPFKAEIIELSQQARHAYKKYIRECLEENQSEDMTVVDVGYQGTIQYYLSKLFGKKIAGKYLLTGDVLLPEKIGCKCEYMGTILNDVHPIYDNRCFFESALMVPYGQLLKIELGDNGFKMFFNNADQASEAIVETQKKCMEFARQDAEWYRVLGGKFDYSLRLAEAIWMCIIYYNYLPNDLIDSFELDDAFGGNDHWKYDSIDHCWKSEISTVPFVFYNNYSKAVKKQKIKNMVKKHTPDVFFELFRFIWIKFLK